MNFEQVDKHVEEVQKDNTVSLHPQTVPAKVSNADLKKYWLAAKPIFAFVSAILPKKWKNVINALAAALDNYTENS